jgi:addiction module RelE/StbE family toxin
MKIVWTPLFERDFHALPKNLQARVEKTLRLIAENPRHPSLWAKKMHGAGDVWEASISMTYRITYRVAGDTLVLRRVGTHDVLKKEAR